MVEDRNLKKVDENITNIEFSVSSEDIEKILDTSDKKNKYNITIPFLWYGHENREPFDLTDTELTMQGMNFREHQFDQNIREIRGRRRHSKFGEQCMEILMTYLIICAGIGLILFFMYCMWFVSEKILSFLNMIGSNNQIIVFLMIVLGIPIIIIYLMFKYENKLI